MAVEVHVFFCGKLPTKSALTKAMKELGFPISIKPATGSLDKQSGFMPMLLRRDEAGVEFDTYDGRAHIEESGVEDVHPSYDRTVSFRWGGDESEMVCGLCAAAALAKLVSGVVFDEENLMSTDAAIEMARKALGKPEKSKGKREPGTRPADIKRYLKPLLEQRSDLVLIGRLLIVRPVRHILRGAFFDRTSDKHSFRIYRYIGPLYLGGGCLDCSDYLYDWAWQVWQPHFQPLLFDVLDEEVFGSLGRVRTFDDLVAELTGTQRSFRTRLALDTPVTALVLAGQPERAAEYIRGIERSDPDHWSNWVKDQLNLLDRDISAVCAELHDKEARIAKVAQLGDIWEPSPFPAELPPSQRSQVAEPLFVPAPWIARPANLFAEAPQRPGEVRFAKNMFERHGRIMLLTPLTRTEAEDEHRQFESYSLFARLAHGPLLVLRRKTGWNRHEPIPSYADPNLWGPSPHAGLHVWLYSSLRLVSVWFREGCRSDLLRIMFLDVYERSSHRELWHCHLFFGNGEKEIRDSRSGENIRTTTRLRDTDVELATFAMPAFGDFEDVVQRLRAFLRSAGYGDFG